MYKNNEKTFSICQTICCTYHMIFLSDYYTMLINTMIHHLFQMKTLLVQYSFHKGFLQTRSKENVVQHWNFAGSIFQATGEVREQDATSRRAQPVADQRSIVADLFVKHRRYFGRSLLGDEVCPLFYSQKSTSPYAAISAMLKSKGQSICFDLVPKT